MSYLTIATIAQSYSMHQRVAACAAQEGEENPEQWAADNALGWAAAPGWAAAWQSALAADPEADPGANEAAITDGMILAQVQPMLTNG
jgi:hypothetical protein